MSTIVSLKPEQCVMQHVTIALTCRHMPLHINKIMLHTNKSASLACTETAGMNDMAVLRQAEDYCAGLTCTSNRQYIMCFLTTPHTI